MSDSKEEKTIGEIIADARKNAGLSLRGLSSKIEINYSYLADIEKNRRTPSEKVLKALSNLSELNLDFDYLMAYSGRLGKAAENYLKENPVFGKFIRKIVHNDLSSENLESLISTVETKFLS